MSRHTRFALFAGVALAVACADSPSSGRPPGGYAAVVHGDLARDLHGAADIVLGRSGYGAATLSLVFGDDDAADRIALVIARDAPPTVGDYEIAAFSSEPPADRWIGAYLLTDAGRQGHFTATGGVVRITHSRADRLAGMFALDAEGALEGAAGAPLAIVIEGTFDAALVSR